MPDTKKTQNDDISRLCEEYEKEYADDPVRWAEEVLGVTLWSKQREIIDSVFNNPKTAVRSCHSAGKTFVSAVIVLAFMFLRYPAKVVTTAPTWYQVKDLLWSEINKLYKTRLMDRWTTDGVKPKMLTTRLEIEDDWFATGISPKDAVNFQGFHQKHILVVFDEAPGVRPEIVDGADSLLSSGDAHCLWIGNPIESTGHFYNAFRGSEFEKFHISAYDTPNYTDEDVPQNVKDSLLSPAWVEAKKRDWGEVSPLFQSRVLGEFPTLSERQVISLALCNQAAMRDIPAEGDIELGVDVARYGGDLTVYTKKRGNVITEIITDAKMDTMEVTGKIVAMHQQDKYRKIKVDVIGIGSGVVDRLKELGLPVYGINVAESAIDSEKYLNKRVELWFNMRDWLEYGRIPNDDGLIADLTAPQYKFTSKGQYQLESKDETKKRLKHSPDRGDSAVLVVHNPAESVGCFVIDLS